MTYDVYIDGSWSPQRQRGGWAAIILSPDGTRAKDIRGTRTGKGRSE